jgi:hydrogenase expression/formation protein HypE
MGSKGAGRRIQLGHGSGGTLTNDLVRKVFLAKLGNPILDAFDDAGVLPAPDGRLAMTTDSFVVSPLFFAGGDAGSLAIHGTVNDLAVSGARPTYLTLAAILEEGVELKTVRQLAASAADAAREAGVSVVAGDTKVVERGKGDGVFLNTAGVGVVRDGFPRTDRGPSPGDAVLVSGPVGDHGAVILAARSGIEPGAELISDSAPVTRLVDALFESGAAPLFLRDPTRGGLAGVLCDLADTYGLAVEVAEAEIPVRGAVSALCDITGVDHLHLACEGRVVAIVESGDVERVLEAWRGLPEGSGAARIGTLARGEPARVVLQTAFGGARALVRPSAELLPRIC